MWMLIEMMNQKEKKVSDQMVRLKLLYLYMEFGIGAVWRLPGCGYYTY